jgi:hypothetical protein
MKIALKILAGVAALGLSSALHAQDTDGDVVVATGDATEEASDGESLALQLSNPVASLISVPFQSNFDFGGGPDDEGFRYTLNVQPVVPISISDDANLIVRTIVPVVYQDNLVPGGGSQFGLGDTIQSFFYSPKAPTSGGLIWGAGPVFLYPTATDRFTGTEKWGAGPSVVVLKQAGPSTFGMLANHIWSFAGDDSRNDISATFMQPFYSYTTKKATTYSISTETTYDWKSDAWLVPLNVGVSQLLVVGTQPISIGLGARYFVESPAAGPDWGLRLTTTLLFPRR